MTAEPAPARALPSRWLALGLLVAALFGAVFGVVVPLNALEQSLGQEIAFYRRALAQHQAVAARRAELQRAAELADPEATAALLLAETTDAAATAALHERLRELIAASRANLISIQALPAAEAAPPAAGQAAAPGGPRRVAVRVQFAADLPAFQRIVHALESGRPAVVVAAMYLRARTARAAGLVNPLDVQIDLVAFRRDGAG
jgi:general secretion pathway protein M